MSTIDPNHARRLLDLPDAAAPWLIEQRNLAETVVHLSGTDPDTEVMSQPAWTAGENTVVSGSTIRVLGPDGDTWTGTPEQAHRLGRALIAASYTVESSPEVDTVTLTTEQVLSITSGRLLCTFDELNAALCLLTDTDALYTHQVPTVADHVRGHLFENLPWTRDLGQDLGDTSEEASKVLVSDHLAEALDLHGPVHTVPVDRSWEARDPVRDLMSWMVTSS